MVISNKTITSLVQLEYSGFEGATVPICTFTLHNAHIDGYKSGYVRLSDFAGAQNQAPKTLEAITNPNCGWFYRADADTFKDIPGTPIAYWVSDALCDAFRKRSQLDSFLDVKKGMSTGDNDRFLRLWWEICLSGLSFQYQNVSKFDDSLEKWVPYNKGGDFRKWYGNNDYVLNWKDDGEELKLFSGSVLRNQNYYFKQSITWSALSSGRLGLRFKPSGCVHDGAGASCFGDADALMYCLGALNSSVTLQSASILSPTLNYEIGQVSRYPILRSSVSDSICIELTEATIDLSKLDWDSFETSWDFKRHPLV